VLFVYDDEAEASERGEEEAGKRPRHVSRRCDATGRDVHRLRGHCWIATLAEPTPEDGGTDGPAISGTKSSI
jgi:hypothetical protein